MVRLQRGDSGSVTATPPSLVTPEFDTVIVNLAVPNTSLRSRTVVWSVCTFGLMTMSTAGRAARGEPAPLEPEPPAAVAQAAAARAATTKGIRCDWAIGAILNQCRRIRKERIDLGQRRCGFEPVEHRPCLAKRSGCVGRAPERGQAAAPAEES